MGKGSIDADACKNCGPGTYSERVIASRVCLNCPKGQFNPRSRSSSPIDCVKCEAGKHSNTTAAKECQTALLVMVENLQRILALQYAKTCPGGGLNLKLDLHTA